MTPIMRMDHWCRCQFLECRQLTSARCHTGNCERCTTTGNNNGNDNNNNNKIGDDGHVQSACLGMYVCTCVCLDVCTLSWTDCNLALVLASAACLALEANLSRWMAGPV
jgi:hypothetical protein